MPNSTAASAIRVSPALVQAAARDIESVLRTLDTSKQGLTEAEAASRLKRYGPNSVAQEARYRKLILFGKALVNPLVILLSILATVSFLTGDARAAVVMLLM